MFSGLLPIFDWLFYLMSSLCDIYICWISFPYWSYHLEIFSPCSRGCLFILLMVFFAAQKLSQLGSIHLFLPLFPLLLERIKYIAALCQRVFCLCNFKVFCWAHIAYYVYVISYFDDRDPPSLEYGKYVLKYESRWHDRLWFLNLLKWPQAYHWFIVLSSLKVRR